MLGSTDVRQPFPEELPDIVLQGRGAAEDLAVAGPAVALVPLRAVCGDIQVIAFLAPDDIAEELVEHRIAAVQPAGALHLRMQHDGMDLIGGEAFRGLVDPQIAETEEGKPRFIALAAFPADIVKLAAGGTVIARVEIAVLIQHFRR